MAKKESQKVEWTGMPSNESSLKEIKGAVESTYDSFSTIENAKADIKDIYDDLHARYGIPKRVFNWLVKTNYNGSAYEAIQKNAELEEAYEAMQKVSI